MKLIYFLIALFLVGCETVATKPTTTAVNVGVINANSLCNKDGVKCNFDTILQSLTIEAADKKVKILEGSKIALFNEQIISLAVPTRKTKDGFLFSSEVGALIAKKESKVVSTDKSFKLSKFKEILIDAGHGGKDPGAISRTGLNEKEVVLDIAKQLQSILIKSGLSVRMTRDKDEFISLQDRTKKANYPNVDLFVSIHANSNPSRGVFGIEVYSLRDLTGSQKDEDQRLVNQEALFNDFAMNKNDKKLKAIIADMLYLNKQNESGQLARSIVEQAAKYIKTKNRGDKKAGFYVLRNTLVPAVLVEVGFLSNPKEEKLLQTKSYRKKIADGVAKGILEYVQYAK